MADKKIYSSNTIHPNPHLSVRYNAFHLSRPVLLTQLELPGALFEPCHCSGSNTFGILNLTTYFTTTLFSHICYSMWSRQQISWLACFPHFINTHTHIYAHTVSILLLFPSPTSLSVTQQTFSKNLKHHYLLTVYCLFPWSHPNPFMQTMVFILSSTEVW